MVAAQAGRPGGRPGRCRTARSRRRPARSSCRHPSGRAAGTGRRSRARRGRPRRNRRTARRPSPAAGAPSPGHPLLALALAAAPAAGLRRLPAGGRPGAVRPRSRAPGRPGRPRPPPRATLARRRWAAVSARARGTRSTTRGRPARRSAACRCPLRAPSTGSKRSSRVCGKRVRTRVHRLGRPLVVRQRDLAPGVLVPIEGRVGEERVKGPLSTASRRGTGASTASTRSTPAGPSSTSHEPLVCACSENE